MATRIGPNALDKAFEIVCAAAVQGERCPENGSGVAHSVLPALAREGRIRIDISRHNYRTVTILQGPHKGKSTKPDPTGARIWKTITKDGNVVNGKPYRFERSGKQYFASAPADKVYQQPSKPRDIFAEPRRASK